MNILVCSAGRHVELVNCIKKSLPLGSKVITTSNKKFIPALYAGDKGYIVSDIHESNYLNEIMKICEKENVNVITTMLDEETLLLAEYRKLFENRGILMLIPDIQSARLCFDKYSMYKYLKKSQINTMRTYRNFDEFFEAFSCGEIDFPVFVKPISGKGSVGAEKVTDLNKLRKLTQKNPTLIIQEYIQGDDVDVDVYVDVFSKKAVSIFSKLKLESQIGGASKAISFFDPELNAYIKQIVEAFKFNGPIDVDVMKKDGKYYFTEINPRFGAAYIHAYNCGVDFIKFILNNFNGVENEECITGYLEDNIMIKYETIFSLDKEKLTIGENKI